MARVRSIQIRTHRLVSSALAGAYRSNFRGTGIEFEEVRPYQPGDDVRTIDWNVTARMGEPFVKTYVEDRQLVLLFLVDTSRSMDFGSVEKTKRETAAEAAALLAFVAAAQQDAVGLSLFDERPGLHLRPEKGQRHVLRVVREVLAAPARGRASSLAAALEPTLAHQKRRALLFVLSDFHAQESADSVRDLVRAARRHDVILARVVDPFEEELPAAGLVLLEDLESGRAVEVDTRSRAVREGWAAAARERRARFQALVRRAGVDSLELQSDANVADPLARLFRRRAHRLREHTREVRP
jgi:uncharacterized protein (DUF58 family)